MTSINNKFVKAVLSIESADLANRGNRLSAVTLGREVWSQYDQAATAASIFRAMLEDGSLPSDAIASYREKNVATRDFAIEVAGTEFRGFKGSTPEWASDKSKGAQLALRKALDSKFLDSKERQITHPVYVMLANSKPAERVKPRAPRTTDTKTEAKTETPKVESKGVSQPVTIVTSKDIVSACTAFMADKPTASQRRALAMQICAALEIDLGE